MNGKTLNGYIGKTVILIGEVVNRKDQSSIVVRAADGGNVFCVVLFRNYFKFLIVFRY